MRMKKVLVRGVTLIEMLLVLVIAGAIIYAVLGYMQQRIQAGRINKTSAQVQQVLNAGLAFYIANGRWPNNIGELTNGYFLPSPAGGFNNPFGLPYYAFHAAPSSTPVTPQVFFVVTPVTLTTPGAAAGTAASIAGQLPNSYTSVGPYSTGVPPSIGSACGAGSTTCYVVSMVNIPGQNLNNATAVNFAGLYHHGACVPIPSCPQTVTGAAMLPQIFVAPVSVSGLADPDSTSTGASYPITSFSAYATGDSSAPNSSPPACSSSSTITQSCTSNVIGLTSPIGYWRVCVQVITSKGDLSPNPSWGGQVTVMAFTRCSIPGEPSGSTFSVYGN